MFRPILEAMTLCLEEANRVDLVDFLPRYVLFRVGLGMLQPRRIDDVWDKLREYALQCIHGGTVS